jgi:cytochrome c biogenesis protein CcmG/thiol:disulfide interchange protein DsbE
MKLDRILEAGVGVMLCAFVGVLYFSLHEAVVKVGDTAPDFSIKADNGKVLTARDFGGKVLILNFWASWCPPCVSETPSLVELERQLGPKGLVVLGVSQDKDPQAYQEFLNRFHVNYLTAREPTADTQFRYGTRQIPESYIIDTRGKVVEKVVSETNWASEQMIQHVQSLL